MASRSRSARPAASTRPPASGLHLQAHRRNRNGTFAKGCSGNPAGKVRGTRNRLAQTLDAVGAGDAVAVLAKAIELAKDGNIAAAQLILRRAWPVPRGRPVAGLELPSITSISDALAAMGTITKALSAGTISIEEGHDLADILEAFRKMHELADVERRLTALERAAPGS